MLKLAANPVFKIYISDLHQNQHSALSDTSPAWFKKKNPTSKYAPATQSIQHNESETDFSGISSPNSELLLILASQQSTVLLPKTFLFLQRWIFVFIYTEQLLIRLEFRSQSKPPNAKRCGLTVGLHPSRGKGKVSASAGAYLIACL